MRIQEVNSTATAEAFPQITGGAVGSTALDGTGVHVWVSGYVVTERDFRGQGQPFANWGMSRLRYDVGYGPEPPEGYSGVDYILYRDAYRMIHGRPLEQFAE